MDPVKLKFLNFYNSVIVFFISMLGFSSCSKEQARMYGSPYGYFVINGEVKSADTNNPIPEIIIEMRSIRNTENGQLNLNLVQTGFSYTDGTYNLYDECSFSEVRTYQIKYTDMDGSLNGNFETIDTTVVFQDPKFANGDGSWYMGSVEKKLEIKMKPKK